MNRVSGPGQGGGDRVIAWHVQAITQLSRDKVICFFWQWNFYTKTWLHKQVFMNKTGKLIKEVISVLHRFSRMVNL